MGLLMGPENIPCLLSELFVAIFPRVILKFFHRSTDKGDKGAFLVLDHIAKQHQELLRDEVGILVI